MGQYGEAIGIWRRLVEEEGRGELANDLAVALYNLKLAHDKKRETRTGTDCGGGGAGDAAEAGVGQGPGASTAGPAGCRGAGGTTESPGWLVVATVTKLFSNGTMRPAVREWNGGSTAAGSSSCPPAHDGLWDPGNS